MAKKDFLVTYNGKSHQNRGDTNMMAFLHIGGSYCVINTKHKSNCTLYELKELPGQWFNARCFDRIKLP